jgi:hypothetical protein
VKLSDLPITAQARLNAVDSAWQDAMDLSRSVAAKINALENAVAYDKRRPNEGEMAELQRLNLARGRHQDRHQQWHALASNLHAYIGKARAGTLEEAPAVAWPVADNESPQRCIERRE